MAIKSIIAKPPNNTICAAVLIQALGLTACNPATDGSKRTGQSDETTENTSAGPEDSAQNAPAQCSDRLNLELIAIDIWGRALPDGSVTLKDGGPPLDASSPFGGVIVPLSTMSTDFNVTVAADSHRSTEFQVHHNGGEGVFSISTTGPTGSARTARATSTRSLGIAGEQCPIVTVFVGLDHKWFASSSSPPSLNQVNLRMTGQELWGDVYNTLAEAEHRVTWATWFWESDFELSRPMGHVSSNEAERYRTTSLGVLAAKPSVDRRILVNDFAQGMGGTEYISIDSDLREVASAADDQFEVILQGNPVQLDANDSYSGEPAGFSLDERVSANPQFQPWNVLLESPSDLVEFSVAGGSYHQKAVVVDGRVAFVSGMNVKGADWDDPEHQVFNPRRMEIDASASDRADVSKKEMLPDYGPRKDYGLRVEGPVARDVESILHGRWALAMQEGAVYSENATAWSLDEAIEASEGGVLTQVVATLPPPFNDMSILEAHLKAVSNATEYIYIEDQYFRSPLVLEAIIDQMFAVPDLVLIVVTKPVSDWDPGAKHSYISDATLRELFPDRYTLLHLQSFDVVVDDGWFSDEVIPFFEPIDTHSKLRLVDDIYLSAGSANFNNRGYLYEGEMNIEVLDEGFGTNARRDIFSNLVGEDWSHLLTDDARTNFDLLVEVAANNQAHQVWWEDNAYFLEVHMLSNAEMLHTPSGFVYPLEFSSNYHWDVGPDLF